MHLAHIQQVGLLKKNRNIFNPLVTFSRLHTLSLRGDYRAVQTGCISRIFEIMPTGMQNVPSGTADSRRTTGVGVHARGSASSTTNQATASTGPADTESPGHPGTDVTGPPASLAEKRTFSDAELASPNGLPQRPARRQRSAVAADLIQNQLPATAA